MHYILNSTYIYQIVFLEFKGPVCHINLDMCKMWHFHSEAIFKKVRNSVPVITQRWNRTASSLYCETTERLKVLAHFISSQIRLNKSELNSLLIAF